MQCRKTGSPKNRLRISTSVFSMKGKPDRIATMHAKYRQSRQLSPESCNQEERAASPFVAPGQNLGSRIPHHHLATPPSFRNFASDIRDPDTVAPGPPTRIVPIIGYRLRCTWA